MVPIKLFWSDEYGDNFSTASNQGEQDAKNAGYRYIRSEGYVALDSAAGLVPLKLFWSDERNDNFTTATKVGEQDALNANYKFVRIEGWVKPNCRTE